jgi:DNA-binding NtrC family response regulator
VLSATNIDINREVSSGAFREDLLYRLNTVEIHLPPLRERAEDIAALANHFLVAKAARYAKVSAGFSPDAMAALESHPWPGNVRELEHVVERALVLAEDELIAPRDLSLRRPSGAVLPVERMTLADAETHLLRGALERAQGNVPAAANALGLSRSAMYRRLQALGLKVHE